MATLEFINRMHNALVIVSKNLKLKIEPKDKKYKEIYHVIDLLETVKAGVNKKNKVIGPMVVSKELGFLVHRLSGVINGLKQKELKIKPANLIIRDVRIRASFIALKMEPYQKLKNEQQIAHQERLKALEQSIKDATIIPDKNKKITNLDEYKDSLLEKVRLEKELKSELSNQEQTENRVKVKGELSAQTEKTLDKMRALFSKYDATFKPKLPTEVTRFKLIKLPVLGFTIPSMINRTHLNKLPYKIHETYPGIIFEKQWVVAVNRDDYNSPKITQLKQEAIQLLSEREEAPYIDALQGAAIYCTWTPSIVYLWLMNAKDLETLNGPKISRAAFPFSDRKNSSQEKTDRLKQQVELLNRLTYKATKVYSLYVVNLDKKILRTRQRIAKLHKRKIALEEETVKKYAFEGPDVPSYLRDVTTERSKSIKKALKSVESKIHYLSVDRLKRLKTMRVHFQSNIDNKREEIRLELLRKFRET